MSSFQPIFKWTIGNQSVYLSSNLIFLFENEKFIKAKPLSPFLSPFINDNLHIFEARYTKVNDSIVDLSAVLKYLDSRKKSQIFIISNCILLRIISIADLKNKNYAKCQIKFLLKNV